MKLGELIECCDHHLRMTFDHLRQCELADHGILRWFRPGTKLWDRGVDTRLSDSYLVVVWYLPCAVVVDS